MSLLENKKAKIRFSVLESYSAGMELLGSEVKALRQKHGSLEGARIVVRGGEAYMVGASIPPYQPTNTPDTYDAERPRKLLLSKKELRELVKAEETKGLTIVPLEVYNTKRLLKLRLAVVRGKGKADRREDIKRHDAMREAEREARGKR